MFKSQAEIKLDKPNMDGNNPGQPILFTYHMPAGDGNGADGRIPEGFNAIPDSGLNSEYMRLQDDFMKWQHQLLQNQHVLHSRVAPIASNPPTLNNMGKPGGLKLSWASAPFRKSTVGDAPKQPVEINIPIHFEGSDDVIEPRKTQAPPSSSQTRISGPQVNQKVFNQSAPSVQVGAWQERPLEQKMQPQNLNGRSNQPQMFGASNTPIFQNQSSYEPQIMQQDFQPQAQQSFQPQAQQSFQPQAQQSFQPQAQQSFQPQAQQSFHPQAQQSFHPQAQQSFHPQAQQGFHPQTQQGFQPQTQQGFQPQTQQGFQPQTQQGFQPQTQQGLQPQTQQGFQPQAQQSFQPQINQQDYQPQMIEPSSQHIKQGYQPQKLQQVYQPPPVQQKYQPPTQQKRQPPQKRQTPSPPSQANQSPRYQEPPSQVNFQQPQPRYQPQSQPKSVSPQPQVPQRNFTDRQFAQNTPKTQYANGGEPISDRNDDNINARFKSVVTLNNDQNNTPQKDKVRSIVQFNNTDLSPTTGAQMNEASPSNFNSKIISNASQSPGRPADDASASNFNNKIVSNAPPSPIRHKNDTTTSNFSNKNDSNAKGSRSPSNPPVETPMSFRLVQQQQQQAGSRSSPSRNTERISPPKQMAIEVPRISPPKQMGNQIHRISPPKQMGGEVLRISPPKQIVAEKPRFSPPKQMLPGDSRKLFPKPIDNRGESPTSSDMMAPPPPPPPPVNIPLPPPPPSATGDNRRSSVGKKYNPAPPGTDQLDSREELMMAIKKFGGSGSLRRSERPVPN